MTYRRASGYFFVTAYHKGIKKREHMIQTMNHDNVQVPTYIINNYPLIL